MGVPEHFHDLCPTHLRIVAKFVFETFSRSEWYVYILFRLAAVRMG